MSWAVTLKIVECAASSNLIVGAQVYSPIIDNLAHAVYTDSNGQVIIFDAYGTWEWVNVTISKAGTGGAPSDPGYSPGYIAKNFIVHSNMDGTIQTICLNAAPIPEPGTGEPISCFIVSATTGASDSVEVQSLRLLRDRIRAASGVGGHLIDAIYAEYRQFSPEIAGELERDVVARDVVLETVVRPLLAWYRLAGTLALDDSDPHVVDAAAEAVRRACPRADEGISIARLLEMIWAGEALPGDTPLLVRELASRMASFPLACWAMFDPLIRVWRCAAGDLNVVEQVGQWLSTAPLEVVVAPGSSNELLSAEFGVLTDFLRFSPVARQQLGGRLRARWPDAEFPLESAGISSRVSTREEAR